MLSVVINGLIGWIRGCICILVVLHVVRVCICVCIIGEGGVDWVVYVLLLLSVSCGVMLLIR